jgi:alkanesulfonate monooxygenase SsuD/methylene tetrahydromethanopterin reductase-like flavin-dependent oxidoreductase (luciferase family)
MPAVGQAPRFGINFFPSALPTQKSGEQFFREALALGVLADELGFSHVRTVEHYFRPYGGWMPNPVVFLAAVAARTRQVRVVTGAVLPVFNHPIKLAGELAMLDCISGGRLDAGFGRAFLPEEFAAFQRSLDESRPRFEAGIEAVTKLWTQDQTVHEDPFYRFGPVSMLPRPAQQPHPPILIAAVGTPSSFEWAGQQGHGLMIVPYLSKFEDVQANLARYRAAFAAAQGGSLPRPPHMSFHMHVAETDAQARMEARPHIEQYTRVFRASAAGWQHTASAAYPGYTELVSQLERLTFDVIMDEGRAFVGSPDSVARQVQRVLELFGDVEPSLSIHFGNFSLEQSQRSLRLFAAEVRPRLQRAAMA